MTRFASMLFSLGNEALPMPAAPAVSQLPSAPIYVVDRGVTGILREDFSLEEANGQVRVSPKVDVKSARFATAEEIEGFKLANAAYREGVSRYYETASYTGD